MHLVGHVDSGQAKRYQYKDINEESFQQEARNRTCNMCSTGRWPRKLNYFIRARIDWKTVDGNREENTNLGYSRQDKKYSEQ